MSGFFARVYAVVRQIPCGKVATYGQIAALLEHPHAARTVGWALAATPAGADIPWQRVVNRRGRCSTAAFSDPPDKQRRLLEAEGVQFRADGSIDLHRFGWDADFPGAYDWNQTCAQKHDRTPDVPRRTAAPNRRPIGADTCAGRR